MKKIKTEAEIQAMLAAERRRLELYMKYNPKPTNTLAAKIIAAGLVITSTTKGADMARKSGNTAVDLSNFEEKLFLSCE
jgi:hypothetical protein